MKPFNKYDWLKFKDLERCPYPPFQEKWSSKNIEWFRKDDQRMLLIALDRYVNFLKERESR